MKVYSDNAPSWVASSATVLFCLGISDIANAEDTLWDAMRGGKVDFSARYRYEHVDDDALAPNGRTLKDANASTIRTTLGYRTGTFYDFGFYGEVENVIE